MQSNNTEGTRDGKILVVDDDPALRYLLSKFFRKFGYTTEVAENGEECLELQEKFNPDLITLDVTMPNISGYDVARILKEKNPRLVIVMLTSRADMLDQIRGFNSGADDYIVKPFEVGILEARVDNLLKNKSSLDFKANRIEKLNNLLGRDPNYKHVLIVEDDLINARVYSKIMTKRGGYQVSHTENVNEVLVLAETGLISIILMDVSLSRSMYQGKAIDGLRITQLLKENPQTAFIPVLLVTAHAMQGDREAFLKQSGADGYMSKPIINHQAFVDFVDDAIKNQTGSFARSLRNLAKSRDFYRQNCHLLQTELQKVILSNKELKKRYTQSTVDLLQSNELNLISPSVKSLSIDPILNEDVSTQLREEYRMVCSDVAHSLRGEFMNIGSFNQAILELSNSSPEILEECELIQRSLRYSQIRLQKLMDYIAFGKSKIENIEIDRLIAEVESIAKPRLPSGITMKVQVQSDLRDRTILGNADQLQSVLIELVNNSTKALQRSTKESQKLDKIIQIIASYEEGLINLSVIDNASGISEDLQDQLFKEVVKSERGLGMGLYLARKVIHEMGGDLKLKSSEEGTIVTLIFAQAE